MTIDPFPNTIERLDESFSVSDETPSESGKGDGMMELPSDENIGVQPQNFVEDTHHQRQAYQGRYIEISTS